MTRTILVTDDFNRAGPGLGANWANLMTAIRGDITIDSSTRTVGAFSGSGNDHPQARWVGTGAFGNDQVSSLVMVDPLVFFGTTTRIGVGTRVGSGTGAALTGMQAYIQCDSASTPTTILAAVVAGSYTALFSAAVVWAALDAISLESEGNTHRLCKNGVPLGGGFTLTDSSIPTGGAPSIIDTASVFGDSFSAGTVATSSIVYSSLAYQHLLGRNRNV